MNYRHIFHAGNFCDVVKHTVLCLLVDKLREKETPFEVLDTHGGIGLYDLSSPESQKTLEYQNGIVRYLDTPIRSPYANPYVRLVSTLKKADGTLSAYPGSPYLTSLLLRPQDRLWACEWHEDDYQKLQMLFRSDPCVKVRHQNGYEAIRALLPFKSRRGLVFIDPPFENRSEWDDLCQAITAGIRRFPGGTYAVWFPVKAPHVIRTFYGKLKDLVGVENVWAFQFLTQNASQNPDRLNGCGMVLINPPWKIQDKIRSVLTELVPVFSQTEGEGRLYCDWLCKKE